MPYSDSLADNVRLVGKTLTRLTDISGRSRRLEVVCYLVAAALIGGTINLAVANFVSFEESRRVDVIYEIALFAAMIALFVRRLHDQGFSGWWGILLPLAFGLNIPSYLAKFSGDITESIAWKSSPAGIVAALCGVSVLIFCMMPGTDGDNRYGPDPRLETD